ncbi:MAG: tRNA (N6-isopentenyl adenosine(37)-C2)-methylthiotransferase MiaB [Rhodospirillaceae bacterium]|nr:tRNA (N6-isopentenyl adenosine(37)-C2)-methylthiotransferase MiaB [Rhodospirillaceae bacterium]|tara:strand:+ start:6065 stop:7483 length:1419 start_codon:yes stop_codon:yes gene_type:complete
MVEKTDLKKIFIKTYGCQMNVYDSDRIADVMAPSGYVRTEQLELADMVVLNTCHIREKASEKVYSELGRLANLKEHKKLEGKDFVVALAGCVAQAEGEEVRRRAPCVDIVVGPQTYHRLPYMVAEASTAKNLVLDIEFPTISKFDLMRSKLGSDNKDQSVSAYITVQEGCDRFCNFCVVPYTRGAEYSRPMVDILKEAKNLIDNGARELILLGQNVNAYHGVDIDGTEVGLEILINNLSKLGDLIRIRYTTSHPKDMSENLINAHGKIPQLMPFLHLPVQSGSDEILRLMNRQHTVKDYMKIIEKLRKVREDIVFSSDFIVGYPGETDADFRSTLKLIDSVKFGQAFSFKYSVRPGTPAADLPNQIPEELKKERLTELQDLIDKQQRNFNLNCVNLELPILFERESNEGSQISGRTPYMQWVNIPKNFENIGDIYNVVITEGYAKSLGGKIIKNKNKPTTNKEESRSQRVTL